MQRRGRDRADRHRRQAGRAARSGAAGGVLTVHPRFVVAGNASPFTLDGTRTHLVGETTLAVVDPGPDDAEHVRALVSAVEGADRVTILLTHGHADHAGAAAALAEATGAEIAGPGGVAGIRRLLVDGDAVATDLGDLVAVSTPGHAANHLCFHWPSRRALFAGDLLLGRGDTTWVGEYPGCVADYLASLDRVGALELDVVYPAHGPPLTDPETTLQRYRAHRLARIEQVRAALAARPDAEPAELVDEVYGIALPERVRRAATASMAALVEHVRASASV